MGMLCHFFKVTWPSLLGAGAQMVPPNSRTHTLNHPTPDLGSKYNDKLFFGDAGFEAQKQ